MVFLDINRIELACSDEDIIEFGLEVASGKYGTEYVKECINTNDINDMILNFDNMLDREKDLRENYTISKYVGYFFCETGEKYKLILVSEIDPALLKNTKIIVTKTLEEALEIAYNKENKNLTINLMPHGASTLPKLVKN